MRLFNVASSSGSYTSRSDTEIPHKPFFESVQWSRFILMNINHMNNALSWIECNGILSVKEMALLIQSFARNRGSFKPTLQTHTRQPSNLPR